GGPVGRIGPQHQGPGRPFSLRRNRRMGGRLTFGVRRLTFEPSLVRNASRFTSSERSRPYSLSSPSVNVLPSFDCTAKHLRPPPAARPPNAKRQTPNATVPFTLGNGLLS